MSEGRRGEFRSGAAWRASGGRHLWTEAYREAVEVED